MVNTKRSFSDSHLLIFLYFPNAPRSHGTEAGQRLAKAGAAAFSEKADFVFLYNYRKV